MTIIISLRRRNRCFSFLGLMAIGFAMILLESSMIHIVYCENTVVTTINFVKGKLIHLNFAAFRIGPQPFLFQEQSCAAIAEQEASLPSVL